MVSAINPAVSALADCEQLALLQRELLWSLYDSGHLERYPMALGNLGDLEDLCPSIGSRRSPLELFLESIEAAKKVYEWVLVLSMFLLIFSGKIFKVFFFTNLFLLVFPLVHYFSHVCELISYFYTYFPTNILFFANLFRLSPVFLVIVTFIHTLTLLDISTVMDDFEKLFIGGLKVPRSSNDIDTLEKMKKFTKRCSRLLTSSSLIWLS